MKTIGMLGGMTWQSSQVYYRLLNEGVQARLGGVHSAKIVMDSCDFGEMAVPQREGRWDDAIALQTEAGMRLKRAGADFLLIACNTMHLGAEELARATGLEVLHIADALGEAMRARGIERAGLLGSARTMDDPRVISGRLKARFDIACMAPEAADHAIIDAAVYNEFPRGLFLPATRMRYAEAMARLAARGAQAIILGCTEIPMLVKPEDTSVPTFDTTALHAAAAVEVALA